MTVKTVSPLRRGLYGLAAAGLLSATAPVIIASPLANAACGANANDQLKAASAAKNKTFPRMTQIPAMLTRCPAGF